MESGKVCRNGWLSYYSGHLPKFPQRLHRNDPIGMIMADGFPTCFWERLPHVAYQVVSPIAAHLRVASLYASPRPLNIALHPNMCFLLAKPPFYSFCKLFLNGPQHTFISTELVHEFYFFFLKQALYHSGQYNLLVFI